MAAPNAFVREIAKQGHRIEALERAQRLKNSAVPDSLPVYDKLGQLRMLIGLQTDGTFSLESAGGSKPPRPSAVIAVPEPKGATIVWLGLTAIAAGEEDPPTDPGDGSWEAEPWTDPTTEPMYFDPRYASYDGNPPIVDWDDYPTDDTGWVDPDEPIVTDPNAEFLDPDGRWPADLAHVEIHLKKSTGTGFDPEFTCIAATQVGTFTVTSRTMSKTVLGLDPLATYWIRLVAVSKSGKRSRASDPASVVAGKDALVAAQTALEAAVDALAAAEDAIDIGTAKNKVWPPSAAAPTVGPFTVNDLWVRSTDMRMHLWDGSAWVQIPDSSIAAALSAANAAAADAAAAAVLGTSALTAANGKNKRTTSTADPGTAANTVGDTWWVKDPALDVIIRQWDGLGGTSWVQRTLASSVIANLDVGKLTAGSGLTTSFTVKSTLTLGDATTNGSLQSYNYASATTGVYLDKNGITAKGGTITGATVQSGAAKLDSAGLTIYNSGGSATFYVMAGTGQVVTVGGFLSGGDISGATVTGGILQTDSSVSPNQTGIKMNSAGFIAYNAAHVPTFSIVAATGAVSLLGTLNAGSTITGSTITGSTFTTSGTYPMTLNSAGLAMAGSSVYDTGLGLLLTSGSSGVWVGYGGAGVMIYGPGNAGLSVNNISADSGTLNLWSAVNMHGNALSSVSQLSNGGGDITMNAVIKPLECYLTTTPMSTLGEIVYMGASGRLYTRVAASNSKYKRDIVDLADQINLDSLAGVGPISFRYRHDVPFEVDDFDAVGWGIRADVAANLGGLDFMLEYGDDGEVFQAKYERLPLALLAGFGDHHPRIAKVEARAVAAEARLADLEQQVATLLAAA